MIYQSRTAKTWNKGFRLKKDVLPDNKFIRELVGDGYSDRKFEVLWAAKRCWDSLSQSRKLARRCRRYAYGDQWSDLIENPEKKGEWITEDFHIRSQGNIPLKNNLIKGFLNAVLGQYRGNETDTVCTARDREEQEYGEMMTVALQANHQINMINELDARTLEAFLISAVAVHKESWGYKRGKMDSWTEDVPFEQFFVDPNMKDVRHWDIDIIGQIHDMSFQNLLSTFSKKREDAVRLKNLYAYCNSAQFLSAARTFMPDRQDNVDFLVPFENGLCRVIEVWRKETKERLRCHDLYSGEVFTCETSLKGEIERENNRRIQEAATYGVGAEDVALIEYEWVLDRPWCFYFLTPYGDVIEQGECPYNHKEHPYTIKIYPFINKEAHSFVESLIDAQRYVNRMIILNDFLLRNSAKGVLMFPDALRPDDMSKEDIAHEWIRHDGVIFYTPKPGVELPKQIASNLTNVGTYDMISLQMKLMQETSGVYSAMQGKDAPSGTAASLYRQQSINSSNNLSDILTSYKSFLTERDTKKVKMLQQFYTEKRYFNITGNTNGMKFYDPDKVCDVEYDIAISDSIQTPTYRMAMNELLVDLFKSQAITVEQMLETGNFPFADKLLQSIRSAKENMQEGGVPGAIPQDVMNQVNANANPQMLAMLSGGNNNQVQPQ